MKRWIKSKTVRVGILQLLAAVSLFVNEWFMQQNPEWYKEPAAIALFINGVVMVVLRWYTDQPIDSPIQTLDNLRPRIKRNADASRYQPK